MWCTQSSLGRNGKLDEMDSLFDIHIARTSHGKIIYPKTMGQLEYYHSLKDHDVVFAIGPAGTGKNILICSVCCTGIKES